MAYTLNTPKTPPKAKKNPKTFSQLGRDRTDEYSWMKDENWQAVMRDPSLLNPDIRAHLEMENAYTKTALNPLEPLKDIIFEEMKARLEPEDSSVLAPDGDYAYYHRFRKGDQHGLFARKPIKNGDIEQSGDEEATLDVDELAKNHTGFFDLGTVVHSRNHNRLAYSQDVHGAENYEIFVKDLKTGETRSTDITTSTGGIVWAADNQTLFWVERDENQRPYAVYARNIDGEAPVSYTHLTLPTILRV